MSAVIWEPPPRTSSVLATMEWALNVALWPVAITPIDDKRFDEDNRGKAPLGGKGWGLERQDLDWFKATLKRNPGAGVGLKLGPDGGVIDIDVDEPEKAGPVLERLFPGGLPPTLGWSNVGGRFHLLLRWDDRLARLGKTVLKGPPFYPGLELRIGTGSKQAQSVVPPSMLINAARRRWNDHGEILPLPESVLEDLERSFPPERKRHSSKAPGNGTAAHVSGYVLAAIERECSAVAAAVEGTRNDRLNVAAFSLGTLVGAGQLGQDDAITALSAAADAAGLGELEAAATIRSGLEAGKASPRDMSGVGQATRNGTGHHANGKPTAEPSRNGPPPDGPTPPAGGDDEPEIQRPDIVITPEEHEVIDQAVEALAADPTIYQRCNKLVTVLRDTSKKKRLDPTRPAGTPQIAPLPSPRLRERMTKFARWCKRIKTRAGMETISSHPTEWAVAGVACRGEWPSIRNIEGVIEAPTIRADGSILDEPGWDAETGLVYEPNCLFPAIPKNPSQEDAKAAAARLLALVMDFPFTDDHHRAAWLSAMLTPLARWAIDGPTPLFLFDANTPGVGKSKLADLVAILATGRVSVTADYPDKEEEMAKSLLAIALAADRLVLFDNVSTGFSIGGKSLDRVLTSGMIKGRILGRSEWTPALAVHTVFLATGNNLNLKGDALRRVIPCRLESEIERPEERKGFAIADLLGHARAERGNLVVAALTILRAYILAGRPDPNLTPMDYRAWCSLIRNAVHWSTGLDPCKPRETLRENDPESNFRRALVHGWAELPGAERGLTVAEAIKHLEENKEYRSERFEQLRGALLEKTRNGELPSRGSIGKLLGANKGRVVDGKALHQGDAGKHTVAWKVIDVTPAPRGGDSGDSGDIWERTREKGTTSGNTASGAIEAKHPHYHHYPHQGDDREVTEL